MIHHVSNPRAKRLSLRVDHKAGHIRLTIPPRCTEFSINRFLNKNRDWIDNHLKSLLPKVEITDGAIIPFLGHDHEIRIENHGKRTTEIEFLPSPRKRGSFDNNEQTPAFAGDTTGCLLIKTSRTDPTTNLKRWIVTQAQEIIEPMAHEKAAQIRKKISKIDLRDTASRWGSCSSDKRLMFSWRLIMAPDYVLDYVVGHEVAHLKRMDHSRKFWDICYSLSDRPDEARAWLKMHGNELMRWF